eukprot:5447992-Ditylum_brightwellii.AAC.1
MFGTSIEPKDLLFGHASFVVVIRSVTYCKKGKRGARRGRVVRRGVLVVAARRGRTGRRAVIVVAARRVRAGRRA